MKFDRQVMNGRSLRFLDNELENRYLSSRLTFGDLPLSGRIFLGIIIFGVSIRRIQLLLDAYYGTQTYDPSAEVRLTIEYLAGLVIEIMVYFVKCLSPIRGIAITIGSFWTVVDGSCFYYPVDPALIPMY